MSSDDRTIIDAWIQHPTPELLRQPFLESILRWMGFEEFPEEVPLEMTVGALDGAGVSTALVCAWEGPHGTIISNDEVASFVEEQPGLLVGVGSVDISRPMEAVCEVRRCVEELGFKAIRVLPWLWNLPPNDRRYYPVYTACVEMDVPFCLQVGHTGPLRRSEPGRPIPYLDDVAIDFPELTIVGGHVGYPWTSEMISMARKYRNVYIDTSAYKPKRFPAELVDYMVTTDSKKVLFGSNFPMIMPSQCLEGVEELGLSDDGLAAFLGGTARKVFDLD